MNADQSPLLPEAPLLAVRVVCRNCKRPLHDPVSRLLREGPKCRDTTQPARRHDIEQDTLPGLSGKTLQTAGDPAVAEQPVTIIIPRSSTVTPEDEFHDLLDRLADILNPAQAATKPGRDKPLTAVVCRNYQQFRAWCHDNNRNPRDPSLRLVTEERHAWGYWFDDIVLIDGPAGLMEMAQTRIRAPKEQQ